MNHTLAISLIAIPVIAGAMLKYRSDYRSIGRTTQFTAQLLILAFFMPNLTMATVVPWFSPAETPAVRIGWALMLFSLLIFLWWIAIFGPIGKWVGATPGKLVTGGLFRYSRNPGYLSWLIFLSGYALGGGEWLALWPIFLYICLMHAMALIEEEHLSAVFGEEYRDYMRRTPRYLLV